MGGGGGRTWRFGCVDEKVYLPNNNVRRKGAKISFYLSEYIL